MRCALFFLLCCNAAVVADSAEWCLYKATGETRVEYRHDAGKLLEVRAQTAANSTAAAFLLLLEDTANIRGRPTLVANCRTLLLTRWR